MRTSLSQTVRASSINKYITDGMFINAGKNADGNKTFVWAENDPVALQKLFIGVEYILSELFDNIEISMHEEELVLTIIGG